MSERVRGGEGWSEARAEGTLRSLELFGMRFGLDRMRRMMTALGGTDGGPFPPYDTIQVLGTNGKTSTTRMTAAILERHGLRTGAYTSPHLTAYRERVSLGEQELDASAFSTAIARADRAAQQVNRTLEEDDHVTQFELLTAAALWELAQQEVDVGVIEAGLGGRYDATSVVEAVVTVLTNVGLEHTRWLGPTITDISEEKLAVVRPGGTLIVGEGLAPDALVVAERIAGERAARLIHAAPLPAGIVLASPGPFQRRNFAVALAAAGAYLESRGIAIDQQAVRDAAASTVVPGRLQGVGERPLTVLDGAHNPDAVAALVEAMPEVFGRKEPALVMGVLEDKDATEMLRRLLPVCSRVWFTAPPSSRALSPAALESQARQLGFLATTCEPRPGRALAAARDWALANGAGVLATGSVYLVGDLLAELASGSGREVSARLLAGGREP